MSKKIPLSKGKFAIVDDGDFALLSKRSWHLGTWGYATTTKLKFDEGFVSQQKKSHRGHGSIFMHRLLVGAKSGEIVDHVNKNKLDNRRKNLRRCTKAQNSFNCKKRKINKSGYKGVSWSKSNYGWIAQIVSNRQKFHLGTFKKKIDAAKAYNLAAKKLHGSFANLNHI